MTHKFITFENLAREAQTMRNLNELLAVFRAPPPSEQRLQATDEARRHVSKQREGAQLGRAAGRSAVARAVPFAFIIMKKIKKNISGAVATVGAFYSRHRAQFLKVCDDVGSRHIPAVAQREGLRGVVPVLGSGWPGKDCGRCVCVRECVSVFV